MERNRKRSRGSSWTVATDDSQEEQEEGGAGVEERRNDDEVTSFEWNFPALHPQMIPSLLFLRLSQQ
jgi:hypothetical protein